MKYLVAIAILGLTFGLGYFLRPVQEQFGSFFVNENAYSSASYASSSMTNSIATSLLARATSSRTTAKICHVSGGTVFLYKQATSTGVVVSQGDPIYPFASSTKTCATYDVNDPYIGAVWGISGTTSTVSIESVQN